MSRSCRHLPRKISWDIIRKKRLKIDGYTCQKCGRKGRQYNKIVVHHKTYERWGEEEMSDLVTLCESCHNRLHGGSPPFSKRKKGKLGQESVRRNKIKKAGKRPEKSDWRQLEKHTKAQLLRASRRRKAKEEAMRKNRNFQRLHS